MRKKSILLMLALGGLLVSCNDAIDIKQAGEVNNPYEVFKTPNDIKRGVSNIYIALPGETEIEFDSVFTDEVAVGKGNGGQGLISGEYGFFMQSGNGFARSTWSSYYYIINRVNRLLDICDTLIEEQPSNKNLYNDQKAELYGLRAYANLKLFAFFTPDYTNPSGLSIMKVNFVPSEGSLNEYVGRSTVKEISDFILEDIQLAKELRTTSWNNENNYYITNGVLESFKVKLYSMIGNYTELIPIAESIIDGGIYNFSNASEYEGIFAFDPVQPGSEIIWKLARPLGSGGAVASAWYSSDVSDEGAFFYEMGRSLYNDLDRLSPATIGEDFDVRRDDVRYSVNVLSGSKVATDYNSLSQAEYIDKDILLIGKFKGMEGSFPAALKNDIPLIRITDIALLLAEARAANGQIQSSSQGDDRYEDFSSVEGILYTIRVNRSVSDGYSDDFSMPSIGNGQAAWKAILDERRVEFAFEGHRYLDMKRIGAKAGSPGFQRYAKDAVVNGTEAGLPVTDHRMTLPIPTSELNANPKIREQQNPGY